MNITKNDCLQVLQSSGLNLKEANTIYDYFIDKGINWLLLEFILNQEEGHFGSVIADLEEEHESL